jgi:hypothetical protein
MTSVSSHRPDPRADAVRLASAGFAEYAQLLVRRRLDGAVSDWPVLAGVLAVFFNYGVDASTVCRSAPLHEPILTVCCWRLDGCHRVGALC